MDFLITNAYAQTAAPGGGDLGGGLFLWMGLMFVVFYFLVIRPQSKRVKEQKDLVSALKKGDEVITSGGLLGRLTEVGDHFVTLELAENVEVKLQKQAVAVVL